jgi:hypothetical protein
MAVKSCVTLSKFLRSYWCELLVLRRHRHLGPTLFSHDLPFFVLSLPHYIPATHPYSKLHSRLYALQQKVIAPFCWYLGQQLSEFRLSLVQQRLKRGVCRLHKCHVLFFICTAARRILRIRVGSPFFACILKHLVHLNMSVF